MNSSFGLGQSVVKASKFDQEMSKLFVSNLKQQRLLDTVPRNGAWADEFRLLRRNHGEEEIRETLTWYCNHHRDEYVPKTLSASGFRTKYQQIRAAMDRGGENWSVLPQVVISDKARQISFEMGLIWPGNEKQDELTAIQISIDNYTEFVRRLRAARRGRHAGLIEHILAIGGDVRTFVEQWFYSVHGLSRLPGWGGNLARYTIGMERLGFQRLVSQWAREYTGRGGDHWPMVEELLKCTQTNSST